ncbi:MAG: hypothetical protein JNM62_02580 [Flavobacteriales bacterium]|nr:hypothetical protein [Flavobacteriales bacterium]
MPDFRITALLSTVLVGSSGLAQPTITAGQFTCMPGDVFAFRSSDAVSPGPSGAAQLWNYSNLESNPPELQPYVDPSTSAGSVHFPTATVLYEATVSGGGTFYSASAAEVLDLGYFASFGSEVLGLCTDPRTVIIYPFTFGSTFTDDYLCTETGNPFSDRVRIGVTTVTADGYGTLALPYGTFDDCLRLHITTTYTDVYDQTPMNGFGTIETFAFVHPGIRVPLLSTTSSSYVQGDQTFDGSVSNLLDPLSTGVLAARAEATAPFIYPNPAADIAHVTLPSTPGRLQLLDATGRAVRELAIQVSPLLFDIADLRPGS